MNEVTGNGGGIKHMGVSVHLEDDTLFKINSQSTCEVIHIGKAVTGIDMFVNTMEQARGLQKVVAQLVAKFTERQQIAETISQQAARIAELEQRLKDREQ